MIDLAIPPASILKGSGAVSTSSPFLWFPASEEQLAYFLVLCALVSGKDADVQQGKFERMMAELQGRDHPDYTIPFGALLGRRSSEREAWDDVLRHHKVGQYGRMVEVCRFAARCSQEGALSTLTRAQLLEQHGFGLKTASFFIAYASLKSRVAVLDMHVIKALALFAERPSWRLRAPTSERQYLITEQKFLATAERYRILPAVLDFELRDKTRSGQLATALMYKVAWVDKMQQLSWTLIQLHAASR